MAPQPVYLVAYMCTSDSQYSSPAAPRQKKSSTLRCLPIRWSGRRAGGECIVAYAHPCCSPPLKRPMFWLATNTSHYSHVVINKTLKNDIHPNLLIADRFMNWTDLCAGGCCRDGRTCGTLRRSQSRAPAMNRDAIRCAHDPRPPLDSVPYGQQ
jgi:hypothetical protein